MVRVFLRQEYPKGKVVNKCRLENGHAGLTIDQNGVPKPRRRPSAETRFVPRIQVTS